MEVTWRRSRWDQVVHAYRAFGEVGSVALCSHTAWTGGLEVPGGLDRICGPCLEIAQSPPSPGGEEPGDGGPGPAGG